MLKAELRGDLRQIMNTSNKRGQKCDSTFAIILCILLGLTCSVGYVTYEAQRVDIKDQIAPFYICGPKERYFKDAIESHEDSPLNLLERPAQVVSLFSLFLVGGIQTMTLNHSFLCGLFYFQKD